MSIKKLKLDSYINATKSALIYLKNNEFPFLNDNLIHQILLYEYDYIDFDALLIWEDLSAQEIIGIIKSYYDRYGIPVAEVDIDISNDDLVIVSNALNKAQYTFDNATWTVHQNDKDPFPSNPHAHCYQQHVKLHLGNGFLCQTKRVVGKMKKKALNRLQDAIEADLGEGTLKHLRVKKQK